MGWTHSVQQVNFLLQLPDEVVFVLVGLQQPDVLLTLSGQLLKTHTHNLAPRIINVFTRCEPCRYLSYMTNGHFQIQALEQGKLTFRNVKYIGGWESDGTASALSKGVQVSRVLSSEVPRGILPNKWSIEIKLSIESIRLRIKAVLKNEKQTK